jgi:hypothetical protein
MLVSTQEQWSMAQRCEIHAAPGINLILRRRWQSIAFADAGVINLWTAKSQPFWSSPRQVAQGKREQIALRGVLDELAQQGWELN